MIRCVATTVVAGGSRAQRADVIEQALAIIGRADERRLVVTAPAPFGSAIAGPFEVAAAAGRTTVIAAPDGCACCISGVSFRVFLNRQLRLSTPDRLILELAASDHTERVIAMLSDEWFSKVLTIAALERLTSTV